MPNRSGKCSFEGVKSCREIVNRSTLALYSSILPSGMAAMIVAPFARAVSVVLIWTSFLYGPRLGRGCRRVTQVDLIDRVHRTGNARGGQNGIPDAAMERG